MSLDDDGFPGISQRPGEPRSEETSLDGPLGLYVHIPFCEAKCAYCNFAIDPRRPDGARQDRYVQAVLRELSQLGSGPREAEASADTLYFGGGTPSLLTPDRLSCLVEALRARFELPASSEITLEANPRDLDFQGYRAARAAGVNRLSIGVQSLDDTVLRDMGRIHLSADAWRAVALAREAGFDNLSVDLVLGWPGESRERWGRNLRAVESMAPDHVSVYVLEVEGRTLLNHRARRGTLDLPAEDLLADLYHETVEALGALGLERYEISNFARRGFESRHNAKYWDDGPFLGLGMAAHSYTNGRRCWNVASYAGYCLAVEQRGTAVAGERVPTGRERRGEALFTGLRRRRGIDLGAFTARYGVSPLEEFGSGLEDAFAAGLLEDVDGRLRLTDKGVLLSNEVFRAFV